MDKESNSPPITPDKAPHSFLFPGLEIKGFRLDSEIAQGGMGVVWKATQIKSNRIVAFKMILSGFSGRSTDQIRFMAESVAMASVKHPNVVEVLEFGNAEGRPFLAMEFMPGGSLADKIRDHHHLDQKAAAQLLIKICNGVQAAHDLGVVHRDLKPDNILFDKNFEPKVADFGLAKQDEITINTVSHAVLGTPFYMAPEQAEGKSRFVGPQADIYALGVILYECLTGTVPFDGDNHLLILRQVAEAIPQSPRLRVPALSRDIEKISLKCLAKEPAERYSSCRDLAEDLERFIQGRPVQAQKSGNLSRLLYWAKRNRTLAATTASAVALLLIASVGFAALSLWALSERNSARENETKAILSEKRAVSQQDITESQLYISNVQRALTEWKYGRAQTARDLLDECPFEKRGWEHQFVNSTIEANQVVLEGHTAEVQDVAYSPDGKWIASASDDHTIKIWDALQGTLVDTLTDHKNYVRGLCFSADGSTMASASSDLTIKIWDMSNRKLKKNIDLSPLNPDSYYFGSSVALSPDGLFVAVSRMKNFIHLFETASGKLHHKFDAGLYTSDHVSFSPDGNYLISCGEFDAPSQWQLQGFKFITNFGGKHITSLKKAFYSNDGKKIVAGSTDSKVRLWDAANGKLLYTFTGHKDAVSSVAISPDGKWIASGSDDHTIRIWNAENGQFVRTLKGHGHVIRGVVFSPDGKNLLVEVGTKPSAFGIFLPIRVQKYYP